MNDETQSVQSSLEQGGDNTKTSLGSVVSHFPSILSQILDEAEQEMYNDVCSWHPKGDCFIILNRDRFVNEVMPRFFRLKKFASFQRQLNLYGFRVNTQKGESYGYYFHRSFKKGEQDSIHSIQRIKDTNASKKRVRLVGEPSSQGDPISLQGSSHSFGNWQGFNYPESAGSVQNMPTMFQRSTSILYQPASLFSNSHVKPQLDPLLGSPASAQTFSAPSSIPMNQIGQPVASWNTPSFSNKSYALDAASRNVSDSGFSVSSSDGNIGPTESGTRHTHAIAIDGEPPSVGLSRSNSISTFFALRAAEKLASRHQRLSYADLSDLPNAVSSSNPLLEPRPLARATQVAALYSSRGDLSISDKEALLGGSADFQNFDWDDNPE